MSQSHVTVLTPPGSSAVAVFAIQGPTAWPVIQRLFRTIGGNALKSPPAGFVFGRIGEQAADEVILASVAPDTFEVHCHGGTRVVAWLLEMIRANDISEAPTLDTNTAMKLLPFARTMRTAGILLDQTNGAFERAEEAIRSGGPEADAIETMLRRNARVGRRLVEPWAVAIAGAPNAGKSSLLNALAGFGRSVVSPIPGTTRDAVSVSLAFDGWPVDLIDTAGLREGTDALESEGVQRARAAAATSDLVLWVVDVTGPRPESVQEVAGPLGVSVSQLLVVFNKIDLADISETEFREAVRVSAVSGSGLAELVERIATTLVPSPPRPGEPVPFTPELCDRWS